MKRTKCRTDRAWAEININNLVHNAKALRGTLPQGCETMAVVKANAYGHGDVETAKALSREGVGAFAVATIDEGIRLRKNGIKGGILILGYTDPRRIFELRRFRITQTVVDVAYAGELESFGKRISVHIKADTGMHRQGESCGHAEEIAGIFRLKHINVDGIYTHLCAADSAKADDIAYTNMQMKRFDGLLEALKEKGVALPKTHIQSSYGILSVSGAGCGWARIGIALYGAADLRRKGRYIDLKPVLALKSRVTLVRTVKAGESAGYGRAFTAQRDTCIAVLAIGYADGVPRELSCGKGSVLVRGSRAPIIGRICMDQLMIDVTDIPGVKRGDIATLIGRDGSEEITAMQAAAAAGTIPNELLSRLGGRLGRVYIYEAEGSARLADED